jgi:hypothetical protein
MSSNEFIWEKSPLYSGYGIPAIVCVAAGLLASLPHFPIESSDFGNRLGLVVGRTKYSVFKAYVGAETHNPNIAVIREHLDEELLVRTSDDKTLKIVETAYRDGNWYGKLKVVVFVSILTSALPCTTKVLSMGTLDFLICSVQGIYCGFRLGWKIALPKGP